MTHRAMTLALALAALAAAAPLSGCLDTDPAGPGPSDTDPVSQEGAALRCGDRPNAPGYAIATDGDRVTLSRADWLALQGHRDALLLWALCLWGSTGQ